MFDFVTILGMTGRHDRLRRARINAGYESAKDAARHFDWNDNTYSNNENGNAPFSMKAAKKFGEAFGVDPVWLYTGEGAAPSQNRDHDESRVSEHGRNNRLHNLRFTHKVTVKGKVTAGTWRAMREYEQDLGTVLFNAPKLPASVDLYGLIVEGDSVNEKYKDGDIVVVASIQDVRPKNKGYVVLRNYIAVDVAEMTLKQARKDKDGIVRFYCTSTSSEWKSAPPIVIPPRDEFAQSGYELIGVVVGFLPKPDESDEEELDLFEPAYAE